uniref:Uncharacterized protein n=1 Tax=Myoviridae sp. ctZgq1 TaxID=2826666 RepID=A0A8S5LX01_9CAUD|nr:MAG TPA: hypothetical protein [Myoviridae sp. ctZgq1]
MLNRSIINTPPLNENRNEPVSASSIIIFENFLRYYLVRILCVNVCMQVL